MHTTEIAGLLSSAAELIREDRAQGFRFPRGTLETVTSLLDNNEIGTGRNGRTKYRPGTVADLLDAVANELGGS